MKKLLLLLALPLYGFTPVKVTTQSSKGINENFAGVAREIRRTALNQGGIIHQNLKISSSAHITGDVVIDGSLKAGAVTATSLTVTNDASVGGILTAGNIKWVNFVGTGTVVIHSQEGVSSIDDNTTADYTVNFTDDYTGPDTYVCTCSAWLSGNLMECGLDATVLPTAGAIVVHTWNSVGTGLDASRVYVMCIGK